MTLVTVVKDYIEIINKLIETSPNFLIKYSNYGDVLTILNFVLSNVKQIFCNLLSFEWLKQIWFFPILVPDVASSMVSEISVLDGNFHNMLTFLDKPIPISSSASGTLSLPLVCFEKLFTGFVNSLFLWIPTSTATFICFRRFIMQGVEAGFAAALGTMMANIFWLTSILFGFRFIVVPWMSLDLFRYWLGFLLLMKYFWDNRLAYKEVKHTSIFTAKTLKNIFYFHFLLALTEQTSLYPFLSNFSISIESTMLESFPSENFLDFSMIHFSYLLGISLGSYSLINLICWFWQDPAYRFYFWLMNKFKKLRVADIVRPIHLLFQSITVAFAFSSLPYFGIEYAITNPLGFLPNDQTFHQFKQTSFLNHSTSPAYYRSRLNFPRQKFFRYEDWAEYYHRNIPLDTSLYDQGAYRLFTMEDLNYGTDYEWIRRRSDKIKIRSRLKRLRWFPRNWANRLWEFTKTWSRRNVAWRNDILSTYQYSWDSKAPIIWGKLVREELFPKFQTNGISNQQKLNSNEYRKSIQTNKNQNNTSNKIETLWGPDPDWTSKFLWNQNSSDILTKKFWWNWQSRRNLADNNNWWKWLTKNENFLKKSKLDESQINFYSTKLLNLKKDNNKISKKYTTSNSDFWEPQNRLVSMFFDKTQQKEFINENSTLRKFIRKLTARLKNNQLEFQNKSLLIEKNSVEILTLKTLFFLPQLNEWKSFQNVINNLNKVLWWSRLTTLAKANSKTNLLQSSKNFLFNQTDFSKQNNFLERKINKTRNRLEQNQNISETKITISEEIKIRNFLKWKTKFSLVDNKMLKFKKLQKKFNTLKQINPQFKLPISQSFQNNKTKKFNELVTFYKTTNFINKKPLDLSTLKNNYSIQVKNTKSSNITSSRHENSKFNFYSNIEEKNLNKAKFKLLHPLNFYLHTEKNLRKKLRFYGVKNPQQVNNQNRLNLKLRSNYNLLNETSLINKNNLCKNQAGMCTENISNDSKKNLSKSPINNLSIFNFYMKTYFQTYKPTRLYIMNTKMKKQLGVSASARRKGRDYTNKLLKRSKILSGTPWIRQWVNQSGFMARRKRLETWIRRQHYDPNELWSKIMKMDVDLFINRQPASYFLNHTEEKLLHLRRFLLFEYYDSLRWYTYMNHYRTMKNEIGGVKSFTSKTYNQQFKGTFHKVRHLFSLTPSSSNGSLLKFDQLLYNFENSNTIESQKPLLNTRIKNLLPIHEELSTNFTRKNIAINNSMPKDIIEDSTQNLQQVLIKSNNIRQEFIKNLLKQKNYDELINFFVFEQKRTEDKLLNKNLYSFNKLNGNFRNDKFSTVPYFFINFQLKEKLRTNFMISLFRKRQKLTKEYKKASEKLWEKWKLKILWLNRKKKVSSFSDTFQIPIETSFSSSNSKINFLKSFDYKKQKNKNLLIKDLSSIEIGSQDFLNKNSSKKLFEIIKLKKLIKINQEKKLIIKPKKTQTQEAFIDIDLNKITFDTKDKNDFNTFHKQKEYWKLPLKTAIRKSLKEAINIQKNSKTQDLFKSAKSLKDILNEKRIEYRKTLINVNQKLIKQIIKNAYNKALFPLQINKIAINDETSKNELHLNKGHFYLKIKTLMNSLKPEMTKNKFWYYELVNQIEKRNQKFSKINFSKELRFSELNMKKNYQEYSNILLYQKNSILRERSNFQNYILMKKILLNEYSSSLTHHQIRPIPGNRAKVLYEKQSISDSTFESNLKLVDKTIGEYSLMPKPNIKSIVFMRNKIHHYKNYKWLEFHNIKNQNTIPESIAREDSWTRNFNNENLLTNSSLLQKVNSIWSVFMKKIQTNIIDLEANQMDKKLDNKLLLKQIYNLKKNNRNINLNKNVNNLKILLNNKISGTSFTDNSALRETIYQRLTRILHSKQKSINLLDMPNRIRRTKQRRKRQKLTIKRNLLKRHISRKSRRKFFLKTKEINNQRMILDRKYEINERLFLTKINKIDASIPKLDTNIELKKMNFDTNNIEIEQHSKSKFLSLENGPILFGSTLEIPYFLLNSKNKIQKYSPLINEYQKKLNTTITIDTNNNLIDNFIIWLLIEKRKYNLKEDDLSKNKILNTYNKTNLKNLFTSVNTNYFDILKSKNLQSKIEPDIYLSKSEFQTWWLANQIQQTKQTESQNKMTKKELLYRSKSYLSSLIRSTKFINQIILKKEKNKRIENDFDSLNSIGPYLTFKLKDNLTNLNQLENEKNRLRRTLRKSVSLNTISPEKTKWLNKILDFQLNQNRIFLGKKRISLSSLKNEKTLFLNNIALSTWIQKYTKRSFFNSSKQKKQIDPKMQKLNKFSLKDEFKKNVIDYSLINNINDGNNFSELKLLSNNNLNDTSFNSSSLIDLNKYIITSRTNPSKLSRQQIRKKTRKRRIIRTKRIERLKTLQDHPLKFRAEQIQNFYNIQDSLKKWKNFAFISSKEQFNDNVWKNILESNTLFEKKPVIFSFNRLNKHVNDPFLPERDYKPLKSLKSIQKTFISDLNNLNFLKQQTKREINVTKSDFSIENSNSDLLYKLYSHLFVNSSQFLFSNKDTKEKGKNSSNENPQKLLLNTNPIPFYAGWDETMRKFVITNRLLSRKEAGYEINVSISNLKNAKFSTVKLKNNQVELELNNSSQNIKFSSWPLKGKNSSTTLFSQFPFMTAPDILVNYSPSQIIQLKGGTKYKIKSQNELQNNSLNNSTFIAEKWISQTKQKFHGKNTENLINFKKEKRMKNQIKSTKNENPDRIRKYGQVISNVTMPSYRKNRRSALFAPLRWRKKYETTKSILMGPDNKRNNKSLFKSKKVLNTLLLKNSVIDEKINAKITLLRTFRPGNRAQTRIPRIERFLKFKRGSGSSWKNTLSSFRRKKRRIKSINSKILFNKVLDIKKTNKLIKESGWNRTRFIIKKRKKRGSNKNPRLRGDKNIRATKRQLRQKLYLRPKKRPLRRRSLAVYFQNKLNYVRSQSINISSQINLQNLKKTNQQTQHLQSIAEFNQSSIHERISLAKNFIENSKYSNLTTQWNKPRRSRQLYRNLFKNPSVQIPILYETLPAHNRSIPLIKNLPAPGSSVKNLNRIIKWSSADGASRFHRVNLAYGWTLKLFLNNLHQKIKLKKHLLISDQPQKNNKPLRIFDNSQKNSEKDMSVLLDTHQNESLKILDLNSSTFSSVRSFKRRSLKLRQLSYTMSMRLYDRWFFYYFKNTPFRKREEIVKNLNENILNFPFGNGKRNILLNVRKFLNFHLNENQTSFRAYLKNLRIKAKKQAEAAIPNFSINKKTDNLPSNYNKNDILSKATNENSLYDFQLSSKSNQNLTKFDTLNKISNKTLLKKEKKLQEDRFFFAQFNRPPLVDDYRSNREVNRHYPLNGGFVWPGDYLRLKTIQLPKQYIQQKINSTKHHMSFVNNFSLFEKPTNLTTNQDSIKFYSNLKLNSDSTNNLKLPTYLDHWKKCELKKDIKTLDKSRIYNNNYKEKIRKKINNIKEILSTD